MEVILKKLNGNQALMFVATKLLQTHSDLVQILCEVNLRLFDQAVAHYLWLKFIIRREEAKEMSVDVVLFRGRWETTFTPKSKRFSRTAPCHKQITNFIIVTNNHTTLASSIGSSLSRVSSSSPSSTPTDSESQSHVGHVVLQTINNHTTIPTSISMQNNHGVHNLNHSARSSGQEEEIAPPIASRPERTKSIVSSIKSFSVWPGWVINCHVNCSIHVQLMTRPCHRCPIRT